MTTPKKNRSPAYPFISLKKALERAQEFYTAQRQHPAPMRVAVSLWGYAPKSSGGQQTIAALKQFGLMQDQGSGEDRSVVLTELALRILRDQRDPSPERDSAIRSAALLPKAHVFIRERWGPSLPADASMLFTLQQDRGYTETAAKELISEYKATIAFAKLDGSDKISADDSVPAPEDDDEDRNAPEDDFGPIIERERRKVRPMEGERVLADGLLSKTATYRLIVSGEIGPREIDRLIKKLMVDREILSEVDPDDYPEEN